MKSFCSRFKIVLGLLFLSYLTNAATLKGIVLDENKEPTIGAYVIIDQSKNAIVGLNGSYQINDLIPGNYKVEVSYIGYTKKESTVTITSNDQVVILNFNLKPEVKLLNEVTVTGTSDRGSDISARKSEKNAMSVLNVVSAKTIELSPDITVANVVQRVSGVSILRNSNGDPQYAIVRGMDRRYNYTLVNGIKIPSPDNKNRYIPLDIFPAALLEKLEVSKALTPSMEGDAIGGVVNLIMKDAPDQMAVDGDLQLGYNQIYLQRKFLQFDKSAVDYKSVEEKYGRLYQAQFSDFSKNNLVINPIQPGPDLIGNLSIGNRFFNGKLGVLIAGGYQNSYRGSNSVWFATTTDYFGSNEPSLNEMHERTYSTQQTRYAGHLRLDYHLNKNNIVKLYFGDYRLRSAQTRDELVSQLDARYYSAENGNAIQSLITRTRIKDQRIMTLNLQGEHRLSPSFLVNWSAVRSGARNEEPDIAQFERNTGITNFVQSPITIERHMPRTWQHNTDNDYTGYLNLIATPQFLGREGELSIGAMYRDKQRKNYYNNYNFDPSPTTQTQGRDWDTYADINQVVLNPLGSLVDAQNYDAHENIFASYLQLKIFILPRLQFLGGARAENTDQGYKLLYNTDPTLQAELSQKYTDLLPSASFKYMPNEHTNVRLNYYKTITRPGYFEIVPYYNNTQVDGYPEVGNPDLRRVQAHNFDLRYEYFPNSFDQILVGTFFKKIKDPIEYATVLGPTSQPEEQPGNFGTAYNWGVELDYTKYFHRFGVKANYTFTHSTITTTKALRQRQDPNDPTSPVIVLTPRQTRPLQGQARHLGNLSLLYKDQKHGTDAQLAMVYTGERIEDVSPFFENDSWVKPFVQLDLSLEQKIGNRFVITLKGQNLLNSPYEVVIKKPHLLPDKEYKLQDSSNSTLIRRDKYYQSYRIGVRFKLYKN